EVDAEAFAGGEGEGVVVVVSFLEDGALGGGEQDGVERARDLRVEGAGVDGDQQAGVPGEGGGAGREVQVAGSVAGAVAEQELEGGGEGGVGEGGGRFGGKRGALGRAVACGVAERIVGGRSGPAFFQSDAGDAFEGFKVVVGDVARVDELLRKRHQVGVGGQGFPNVLELGEGKEALV